MFQSILNDSKLQDLRPPGQLSRVQRKAEPSSEGSALKAREPSRAGDNAAMGADELPGYRQPMTSKPSMTKPISACRVASGV